MENYPVVDCKIRVKAPSISVMGCINIAGFKNLSDYMENDTSKYLKIYNIAGTDANFLLIPKSDQNVYFDLSPKL